MNLRSDPVETNEKSQHDPNSVDFVLPDTFCAIAADINTITGDYDIQITAGQEYIEGQFLEKLNTTTKGHLYRLDKKKTFFFHEFVVYSFAQFQCTKKRIFLSNEEFVEILNYVESNGLPHI